VISAPAPNPNAGAVYRPTPGWKQIRNAYSATYAIFKDEGKGPQSDAIVCKKDAAIPIGLPAKQSLPKRIPGLRSQR